MRIPESWLREWVDPPVSLDQLCDQLTNLGLEVDAVEAIGGDFTDVVVGAITSVEIHPQSDHLTVCSVSTGDEEHQVVCGAPNVRVGMKSAFARINAALPNEIRVKRRAFQGVESNGMLCSASELGVGEDATGILELPSTATLGLPLADTHNIEDNCIEIDLTPNRGDCFSIRGVAREVAVVNELPVREPEVSQSVNSSTKQVPIELEAPEGCPVYLGQIIENLDVNAQVPFWLTRRLNACGIRSVNAIVDILNYVMVEWGQPMHAFDLEAVSCGIGVRRARAQEKLTLLDGTEAKLDEEVLLITSGDRPVAIAGVIGGLDSGVSDGTQSVLLECAFFVPDAVVGTARKYGLQTDASTRYERGVDYELQETALQRATSLILEIAGGSAGDVIEARSQEHIPTPITVSIAKNRLSALIGEEIPDTSVQGIFRRLGFDPSESAESWTCRSPAHRFDISIEEDLVEEVCRVYGYDNVATKMPNATLALEPVANARGDSSDLRTKLKSLGYHEAVTYSFIEREKNAEFAGSNESLVLQNPMSIEREVMRWSLLPGLLDVVSYNIARQHDHVRVYEYGQCFGYSDSKTLHRERLAGVAWGLRQPEGWGNQSELVDFFDLKGNIEHLLPVGEVEWKESNVPWLEYGNGADIFVDGKKLGSFGLLESKTQEVFEIEGSTYVFELEANLLLDTETKTARAISTYPSVRRDLALVLDESISVGRIEQEVSNELGELLVEFTVFDVFRSEKLGRNKKSLAIGMTLQDTRRTLVDTEANDQIDAVVLRLKEQFGAQLRK
ncbi:MAG: phenylalanine--tRNA ligase subunit beta [Gammaproteobacteria bacterium]|nr:phenylalanine--tRNA ligase subunit beta [Gammaproteobacteria bacterium]MYD81501.1 phenylalanine--tRNA ligase subunit beta [Gammaproteobacteria bacterium]